jgi:hypothetical protein
MIDQRSANEDHVRIEVDGPCICDPDDIRGKVFEIPEKANSIVVCCDNCKTEMMRICGFVTREWELYVPEKFL